MINPVSMTSWWELAKWPPDCFCFFAFRLLVWLYFVPSWTQPGEWPSSIHCYKCQEIHQNAIRASVRMWVVRQKQAVTIMFSRLWVESLSRCFHLGREDSFQSKILEQMWFMVNCVRAHITRTAVPGCKWSPLYVTEVGRCSFKTILKTFSDPTDPENKPVCPCRRSPPSVCCTHENWHSVIMWHTPN